MSAAPEYAIGERVSVKHTYGLTSPEWRTGIITDRFEAPITRGVWIYVVAGCGYYEWEARPLEVPGNLVAPQSLRVPAFKADRLLAQRNAALEQRRDK
jgi:hypothetical protein